MRPMRRLNPVQAFALWGGLSVCVLAVTLGYVSSASLERHMRDSEWVTTADIVAHQVNEHDLVPYFTDPELRKQPGRYPEAFSPITSLPEVVKIKLWDRSSAVVWATDARLIGQRFPDNPDLRLSLAGEVSVMLKGLKKQENAYDRERFTQLAEIYVPIRANPTGEIVGVVEVYKLPERLFAGIRQMRFTIWGISLAGGALLYVVLLPVVKRSYRAQLELEARLAEHARGLEAAVQERTRRLTHLNAVSQLIASSLDQQPVFDHIVRAVTELIEDSLATLWLLDEVSGEPVERASRGADRPEDLRATVVMPLLRDGRALGTLSVAGRFDRPFTASEMEVLASLASQATIAIHNTRLYQAMEKSRARLEHLFDSAAEGIYQAAPDGRYLTANAALALIFGYESAEALVASAVRGTERYLDPRRHGEFARRAETEGGVTGFESQVYRKDGSLAWISENARAVRDATGAVSQYEGFVQDITERKVADQMKADFVSFVSHQLRTPLAGIKWLLELAVQEPISEEARSLIGDARESSHRLVTLVNDLLDVSRLERGSLTITPKETDVAALTAGVLQELEPLVREKGHRLVFEPVPDLPAVVVDPQLLRQVILNLASNAVKYTPRGGEIAIRLTRTGGAMLWGIEDNGIGIPKESQRQLFEKFFRAENALDASTEGTGLGLYLVRLIVERCGGRVWGESEGGRGATFRFTLPLGAAGGAPEVATTTAVRTPGDYTDR